MKQKILVIGGGFYGCIVALEASSLGAEVTLVEREELLLQRASYNNQARVHQGYHYPRSILTAMRSRENFAHFVDEFEGCIDRGFTKLYAIAKERSFVTAKQFVTFCHRIGAPVQKADAKAISLFDSTLVEEVFEVQEYAFDAQKLSELMVATIEGSEVQLRTGTQVTALQVLENTGIEAEVTSGNYTDSIVYDLVFNCTYAGINDVLQMASLDPIPLKIEYTELAIVSMPERLQRLGVTVLDGPFFSCMPFPPRGLHSLSHVRYTPHYHWDDNPRGTREAHFVYNMWKNGQPESNVEAMIRDGSKYIPVLREVEYHDSLMELKCVLHNSEYDDSRPILFRPHVDCQNLISILGGKIDNILDIRIALKTFFSNNEVI